MVFYLVSFYIMSFRALVITKLLLLFTNTIIFDRISVNFDILFVFCSDIKINYYSYIRIFLFNFTFLTQFTLLTYTHKIYQIIYNIHN